jgi:polyvinyl alcohol dehydrogenase (cytochrome)
MALSGGRGASAAIAGLQQAARRRNLESTSAGQDARKSKSGDWVLVKSLLAAAGAVAALGLAVAVGPAAPARAVAQAQGASGQSPAQVFDARCKACHEPPVERAISRAEMALRAPESIVAALTTGPMQPMAQGLSRADIDALAVYLSGKPLGAAGAGRGHSRPPSAAPQPADVMCKADTPVRPGPSDWNGYGQGPAGARYQPVTSITPANVRRLEVKWTFSISGGRYGQPAVVGDHLFLTTGAGHAFSLDAATGCVHWRTDLGSGSRTAPVIAHVPGLGSGWVMFVGDARSSEFALDAQSGKVLWKTQVQDHPRGVLTGGSAYHDGLVYVPLSSYEETTATAKDYSCCTFSGAVVALDARTGKIRWRAAMLPEARPTRKNAAGTQLYGPAGAAIWSQPSVDARTGRIYVATGDSYTEVDAPRSDTIVALDAASGRIDWANQVTKADNFLIACGRMKSINCPLGETGPDHDFGATPILAKLPGGGRILLSGQKSGMVYGMDPATGRLVWRTKVGAGSALGGVEWGMAYDGRKLYVAISDIARPPGQGKPGVYALDPATGRILWSDPAPQVPCSFKSPRCSNARSAPPSAIPGVVFDGSHDGRLRAYASADGKPLWEFDTAARTYATVNGVADQPGGSIDATGPVISGDSVYVISGYSGATGAFGNPLNVLIAFSLDGK